MSSTVAAKTGPFQRNKRKHVLYAEQNPCAGVETSVPSSQQMLHRLPFTTLKISVNVSSISGPTPCPIYSHGLAAVLEINLRVPMDVRRIPPPFPNKKTRKKLEPIDGLGGQISWPTVGHQLKVLDRNLSAVTGHPKC